MREDLAEKVNGQGHGGQQGGGKKQNFGNCEEGLDPGLGFGRCAWIGWCGGGLGLWLPGSVHRYSDRGAFAYGGSGATRSGFYGGRREALFYETPASELWRGDFFWRHRHGYETSYSGLGG